MSHGPRYPLHELEEWLGWPTAAELAAVLGLTRAAVEKWRIRGLSERQADRLACRFNLHPVLLWPGWLDGVGQDCTRRARPTYCGESHLAALVEAGGAPAAPLRTPRTVRAVPAATAGDRQAAGVLGALLATVG